MMKQKTTLVGIAALLSLTGGWLSLEAIAPSAVHAYTGRLTISLDVQTGETFESLTRRAEAVARAAAQRSFDRDILVTDVLIIVSAEHLSRIAPILSLEATRAQWSRLPDARRWATYYKTAKTLLGLSTSPTPTAPAAPSAPPAPTTPSAPATSQPTTTPPQPANDATGATPENPVDIPPEATPLGRPQIIPNRIPSPVR